MKYYICLEEDRIWYVRGRFKRCPGSGSHRRLEIVEWEIVEPVPDVVSALTRLAEKHGMEGKRVNLIVGRDEDDGLHHSKGGEERYEKNGSQ